MFMRLSAIFLISIFLVACGDKASFYEKKDSTAEANSTSETTTQTTEEEVVKAVQLGILEGDTFTAEKIKLEFNSIKAFETSKLSVYLIDEDGNRYKGSASVSFSSSCSKKGFSNIISPITASNALAESIYTANGCVGQDTITATAFVNDKEISATATIDVEAAVVNSLRYISAAPSSLGIKGFGQVEESTVQFRIMDREGRPVPNQSVSFSLNTAVGGITLYPATATSDEQGNVKTVIHSGKTATNVRVTAVVDSNTAITASSEVLTISTGVADQNSLSLSASILNPNGGNYDGVDVSVNVWAADHFNNPVPDGTKVYFTTEGGQIQPECEIKEGACSVKWHSSNPRPCYGRSTILATMVGEESFIDANGNGVLDPDETYYDKDEAFRDDNEDGIYNEKDEEFWDFNQNGTYDLADGKYNGILCAPVAEGDENHCSTELKNIYARDSLTLVMASDAPRLQTYIWDTAKNSYVESVGGNITVPVTGTNVLLAISGALQNVDDRYNCTPLHEQEVASSLTESAYITPLQSNLPKPSIPAGFQPMPVGTTMKVSVDEGKLSPKSPELELGSTSQSAPSYISFTVFPKDDAKANSSSTISVAVETTGEGNVSSKKETFVIGVFYPDGGAKTVEDAAAAAAEAAAATDSTS